VELEALEFLLYTPALQHIFVAVGVVAAALEDRGVQVAAVRVQLLKVPPELQILVAAAAGHIPLIVTQVVQVVQA
jgi:hypothetical protein